MKRDSSQPLGVPDAGALPSESGPERPSVTGRLARYLFGALMARLGRPPVEFALAHGPVLYAPTGPSRGRVVLRDPGVIWDLVRNPELAFGDAYSTGRLLVDGDLEDVLYHLFASTEAVGERAKRSWLGTVARARRNSRAASREHIQHHYDLGNDFYALWLDERMVYTCAYYTHPDMSLEDAQVAKLEHVCRKLELAPGMQVVEAGCGWGALALHMAREHGVRVRAFNISTEQVAFAREQAERQGLSDRVEFIEDDYRNIPGPGGERHDAFVSIGMLEHVGREHYPELGRVIASTLSGDGRALIHSVGRSRPQPPNAWLERRIFPGSYPPAISEIMGLLEPYRFTVTDLENLRLHYARTLEHWLERFTACEETVRRRYNDTFVRAWRLYLAGCAAAFRASTIQLYQILFTQPRCNRVPLTRAWMYDPAGTPPPHWQRY